MFARLAIGEPLAATEDMKDTFCCYQGPIDADAVDILLPARDPGAGPRTVDFYADSAFEKILGATLTVTRLEVGPCPLDERHRSIRSGIAWSTTPTAPSRRRARFILLLWNLIHRLLVGGQVR